MAEEPKVTFYADVVEEQAKALGDKPYVLHEDQKVSFAEFDLATCRAGKIRPPDACSRRVASP